MYIVFTFLSFSKSLACRFEKEIDNLEVCFLNVLVAKHHFPPYERVLVAVDFYVSEFFPFSIVL